MVKNLLTLIVFIVFSCFCQIVNIGIMKTNNIKNEIPDFQNENDSATNYLEYYFENSWKHLPTRCSILKKLLTISKNA